MNLMENYSQKLTVLTAIASVQQKLGGTIFANCRDEDSNIVFTSLPFLLATLHPLLTKKQLMLHQRREGKFIVTDIIHLLTGEYVRDKRKPLMADPLSPMDLVEAETRTRKQALFALFAVHSDDKIDANDKIQPNPVTQSAQASRIIPVLAALNKVQLSLPYDKRSATQMLDNNIQSLLAEAKDNVTVAQKFFSTFISQNTPGLEPSYIDYLVERANQAAITQCVAIRFTHPDTETAKPQVTVEVDIPDSD